MNSIKNLLENRLYGETLSLSRELQKDSVPENILGDGLDILRVDMSAVMQKGLDPGRIPESHGSPR